MDSIERNSTGSVGVVPEVSVKSSTTSKTIKIFLKSLSGSSLSLEIKKDATCRELISKAGTKTFNDENFFKKPGCILIWRSKMIPNLETPITELNIQDCSTILFTARLYGD